MSRAAFPPVIRYAIADSSLGSFCVAATLRGVCALHFGRNAGELRNALQADFPRSTLERDDAGMAAIVRKAAAQIEQPARSARIAIDVSGTPFQERVWRVLSEIPPGQAISYAELARRAGKPRAIRAAAQACGANPVPVLVPCHRVIRSDGGLGGFGCGIERKRLLLAREGVAIR
jgi:AraC family transcriptional regulator, regulatory protein of adaptative response / methylated-DNA-[protein]-cysteine methyltransferase